MTLGEPLRGTYPRETVVTWTLRLLDLAIRLRDGGYYHCDLKKDNLCLFDGELGLLDYASLTPIAFANTHELRLGSDFHRAPETDCDHVVDERTEIFAIAVTFVSLAGWLTCLRCAVPLLRALLPFPWLRYQTFEDFRRGIVRGPVRFRRLVWLAAGVWKTRIAAGYTVGGIALTAIAFGAIASGTFLFRHWRMCRREEREIQAYAEHVAAEGCRALGDQSNAVYYLRRSLGSGCRTK